MALLQRHGDVLLFWCPGCRSEHSLPLSGDVKWQWDGSIDAPTIAPSLLRYQVGTYRPRCHTVITKGRIQFCQDSTHALAGQNVAMVDWDTIIGEEKMDNETTNTQGPAPVESPAPVATPAPIPIDAAKMPPPDSQFDRAVTHLQFGGFSEETAKAIVNHVGIETVIEAISKSGSIRNIPPTPAPVTAQSGAELSAASGPSEQAANTFSTEGEKQEGPPEPGMRKCRTCKVWYPGGYENCPHDGTSLR